MCERMLCAVVCICILAVVIVEPFASESFRKKNVIKPNSADAARADVRSVLCILATLHRALCTVHTERAYCLSADHVELHNPPYYLPHPQRSLIRTAVS